MEEGLSDYFKNQDLLNVLKKLKANGFKALLAGGAVRDALIGRAPSDFDVVTNASVEQVKALFSKTILVGAKFGIIVVVEGQSKFEVAQFRQESDYRDGRRPSLVKAGTIESDALRRDFTMNALFFDPESCELYDFVAGKRDILDKKIRCVGNPETRFLEDYLRMLRAMRFQAQLGFEIERDTYQAIRDFLSFAERVSNERVLIELEKAMIAPYFIKHLSLPEWSRFIEIWLRLPSNTINLNKIKPSSLANLKAVQNHSWVCLFCLLLSESGILIDKIKDLIGSKLLTRQCKRDVHCFLLGLDGKYWAQLSLEDQLVLSTDKWVWLGMMAGPTQATRELRFYWDNWPMNSEEVNMPTPPPPVLHARDIMARGVSSGPQIKGLLNRAYGIQLRFGVNQKESLLDCLVKSGYISGA